MRFENQYQAHALLTQLNTFRKPPVPNESYHIVCGYLLSFHRLNSYRLLFVHKCMCVCALGFARLASITCCYCCPFFSDFFSRRHFLKKYWASLLYDNFCFNIYRYAQIAYMQNMILCHALLDYFAFYVKLFSIDAAAIQNGPNV